MLAIFFLVASHVAVTNALSVPATRRSLPPTWRFDGSGHYNVTLSGGRWALIHANQAKYDNSVAHPLVFAFHGAGASAQNMEAISNLSNNSLTIGGVNIVTVYGQGTKGSNGITWEGAPYSSSADDIAYVQSVLTTVKANLNIDTQRIYATGFSNGGGFVNLLACTPSAAPIFAAFATSSPALYNGTHSTTGCDSGGHAIAMIDFHGLADGQIPYAGRKDSGGDTAYALPNIDTWRQGWAQRAGCSKPASNAAMAPSTTTANYNGFDATAYRWNCPSATIVGYTVKTMGHWWLTQGGGYWDETPLNIIKFFDARPLGKPTG